MSPGHRLRERAHAMREEGRAVVRVSRGLIRKVGENDLLTFASAIAFQVLFALPAVLLTSLAVLGLLGLKEVWNQELAPRLREATTSDVLFEFVSSSAEEVLQSSSGFWLTLGLVLALWYVSGAVRGLMGVMNRIYADTETRSFWRRLLVSLALTLVVVVCFGLAGVAIYVVPPLLGRLDLGVGLSLLASVARWVVVLVLLALALFVCVRWAPARQHPFAWGSLTAALIIAGWTAASLIFRWSVTSVADYGSVFGNLASVIVLMASLYLSSALLVFGLQVDALVRRELGQDRT